MILELIALAALSTEPGPGAYKAVVASGKRCTVIEMPLGSVKLDVVVASSFPFGDEPFSNMIGRSDPLAAINGAYFSIDSKKPIGDIVIGGKVMLQGRMGTALAVKKDGSVDISRVKFHRTMDWSQYETVLGCGPALVLDGKVDVDPRAEGFTEDKIMQRHARMGVGYTKDGRFLMVHVKDGVTFHEFAQVMLDLDCYEAMNLDAGASLAMYYDGSYLHRPGRNLTNLLVAHSRPSR